MTADMRTPVELIDAAITHIRKVAEAAPNGPWRYAATIPNPGVRSATGWELASATYSDLGPRSLQQMALWDPVVAELVAKWLAEAREVIADDVAMGYSIPAIWGRNRAVLTLAREIVARAEATA